MIAEVRPPLLDPTAVAQLLPRSRVRSYDWIKQRVHLPPDLHPFDAGAYPWTEGICDAYDDPEVRVVALQFAARLGKTAIAQSLLLKSIATHPSTALFGSSTEKLAKQTVQKKLIPMIEYVTELRRMLPPKSSRLQTRLDMGAATLYVAWSGSPTTLADIEARYKHANEVDKWSKDESMEADPLDLFLERGAEVPDRKTIIEGTPTIEGQSRVERWLARGTDCRFHVPCPHCETKQELVCSSRLDHGIKWATSNSGVPSDVRYVCVNCHDAIFDEHKRWMVQRGVWIPKNPVVRDVASFQMNRIYAPTFTFADIACQYVAVRGDQDGYRNFKNSWMGQTWGPPSKIKKWDDAAERTIRPYTYGMAPVGSVFLTAGVDVQHDHLVYGVVAWQQSSAGYVIEYGKCYDWAELLTKLRKSFPHADQGSELTVGMTLIDSRFREDEVLDFCVKNYLSGNWIYPSRGSRPGTLAGKPYLQKTLDEATNNKRRGVDGLWMISVNTNYWQSWMDNALIVRVPGDWGSIAFPDSAARDEDLFAQLINESPVPRADGTLVWEQVKSNIPVDFRDVFRYARCAAEVFVKGAWARIPARVGGKDVPVAGAATPASPSGGFGYTLGARKSWSRKTFRR